MAVLKVTKLSGLVTSPNELTVDKGALVRADNVVLRTPGVLEPRKGFTDFSTSFTAGKCTGLYFYNNNPVVNTDYNVWKVYNSDTATFVQFSTGVGGGYVLGGLIPKTFTFSNNFYYLTQNGPRYIDTAINTSITSLKAGVPAPRDLQVLTRLSSLGGNGGATGTWLPTDSAVSYRVTFGYIDKNQNKKISAPCGRFIVSNAADVSASLQRTSNVVTATVTSHGFKVGDIVRQTTTGTGFTDTTTNFTILTTTSTTFTYAETAANAGPLAGVTVSSGDKYTQFKLYCDDTELTTSHFYQIWRTETITPFDADPSDEHYLIYESYFTSTDLSNDYVDFTDKTPEYVLGQSLYTNPSEQGILKAKARPPYCVDMTTWNSRGWYANTYDTFKTTIKLFGVGSPDGLQAGDTLRTGPINITVTTEATAAAATIGTLAVAYTSGVPSDNIEKTARSIVSALNYAYIANGYDALFARYVGSVEEPGLIEIEGANYWTSSRATCWAPVPIAVTALPITSNSDRNLVTDADFRYLYTNITTTGAHGLSINSVISVFSDGGAYTSGSVQILGRNGVYRVKSIPTSASLTFEEYPVGTRLQATTNLFGATTNLDSISVGSAAENNVLLNGIYYSELNEVEAAPAINQLVVGAGNKRILRLFPQGDRLFVFKEDGVFVISGQEPFRVDEFDLTCFLVAPDSLAALGNQIYGLSSKGIIRLDAGGVQLISKPVDTIIREALKDTNIENCRTLSFGIGYEREQEYLLWIGSSLSAIKAPEALVYNTFTNSWTKWTVPVRAGCVTPVTYSQPELLVIAAQNTNQPTGYNQPGFGSTYFQIENNALTGADYQDGTYNIAATSITGNAISVNTIVNVSVGDGVSASSLASYGIVTAITAGVYPAGTLTVVQDANLTPFSGAPTIVVHKAISTNVTFICSDATEPTNLKHFREATAYFRSHKFYSSTNLKFFNAWDTTARTVPLVFSDRAVLLAYDTTTRVPPTDKRVLVPKEVQQAPYLIVGFTSSEARSYWALNGYALTFEGGSERNSR